MHTYMYIYIHVLIHVYTYIHKYVRAYTHIFLDVHDICIMAYHLHRGHAFVCGFVRECIKITLREMSWNNRSCAHGKNMAMSTW